MRLGALTTDVVQRAIAIYQDLAYGGGGKARRPIDLPAAGGDALLGAFCKEQIETIPGHPCCRYSLRLGNRNYPFMKLLLQEHLVPGEFYFSVDTHDQMEIRPDFPDYEAWMAVRRFNRDLKRRIEEGFQAAGLDTCARLRELLTEDCADVAEPSRGLVLVVVRTKPGESGPITLRATSPGLAPTEVTLQAK